MQFDKVISNVLKDHSKLNLLGNTTISEGLRYCIDNNLAIYENPYRIYSDAYFQLIQEARELYYKNLLECVDDDVELFESEIGKTATFNNQVVFLDAPIEEDNIIAEEKSKKQGQHKLGKPFRTPGGPKKFAVYVRSKSGGVKKVTFGDPNLKIKNTNPSRAKSFRARHKCSQKKDRTTAGYWSCNVGRYAKALGLKSSTPW